MVVANPFKPTAGRTPPILIGRDDILNDFVDGINNGPGAPERLMRVTGMRGMGKTVMLNEFGNYVSELGWTVVNETANAGLCTRVVECLLPKSRVKGATISPSILGFGLGGLEFERASLSLREAMGAAMGPKGDHGLLITLDEVQDSAIDEIRSLSVAVQHMIREEANIAFVFAGLPSMVDSVVNGKTLTFLRRAVPVELGMVDRDDVIDALRQTVVDSGLTIEEDALESLADVTRGYPFMIQLAGYHTWQAAFRDGGSGSRITCAHVEIGARKGRGQFDRMVIEPVLQRLAPTALLYLHAMAQDGGAPSRTSDIAKRLDRDLCALSSFRERLIEANVIESRTRGTVEFTIPYMADYLLEHRSRLMDDIEEVGAE